MGAGNRSAIGTLVERTTRYLVLLLFSDGIATTDRVRQAITNALERIPAGLRRTLTWDQGKELAQHQQITAATGTDEARDSEPTQTPDADHARSILAEPCRSVWNAPLGSHVPLDRHRVGLAGRRFLSFRSSRPSRLV